MRDRRRERRERERERERRLITMILERVFHGFVHQPKGKLMVLSCLKIMG